MLSQEKLDALRAAKEAIESWRDARLARLDAQAEFLRSLDISLGPLSEGANTVATDYAEALVDDLGG